MREEWASQDPNLRPLAFEANLKLMAHYRLSAGGRLRLDRDQILLLAVVTLAAEIVAADTVTQPGWSVPMSSLAARCELHRIEELHDRDSPLDRHR